MNRKRADREYQIGSRIAAGLLFLLLVAPGAPFFGQGAAAWIGLVVTYQDAPDEGRMTVITVYPSSPAAAAGVKVGDVISRVNDTAFRFENWTATVAGGGPFVWAKPGDHVRTTVLRDGKTLSLDIVAAAPPASIVDERKKFQQTIAVRRGPEVLENLSRIGTLVKVERRAAGSPVEATSEGVSVNDLAALSSFLNSSRLSALFTGLEPGRSMKLRLSIEPTNGEPKVEVLNE